MGTAVVREVVSVSQDIIGQCNVPITPQPQNIPSLVGVITPIQVADSWNNSRGNEKVGDPRSRDSITPLLRRLITNVRDQRLN